MRPGGPEARDYPASVFRLGGRAGWGLCVLGLVGGWGLLGSEAVAGPSVARLWNGEALAAIRVDVPDPPVHARNLFYLAAAMYDAWAAYDGTAIGWVHHERVPEGGRSAAAREEAMSYAAYRVLRQRLQSSVSAEVTLEALEARMAALGYRSNVVSTAGWSPSAVGNRVAASLLAWGLGDGSNEAGGYRDPAYSNSQPALVVLLNGVPLGGGLPFGTDPNRWQPLSFDVAFTQNGLSADLVQRYAGVTWLRTRPFAWERADETRPWFDPGGGPSRLGTATAAACRRGALDVLRAGSRLGSARVIDISPGLGGQGNHSLGRDDGGGHAVNPATGQPYEPNLVAEGDFARVLAEYWADGPRSETPPGHWHVLANAVSDHPELIKRIGGAGPVVDDLEWEVKLYFALSAATHDAACAAWSLKRYYQGPRPITLIRHLSGNGQSSDRGGPFFHPEGLPLEPGVAELITETTAAPGGRHHGVGAVGEIAVYAWPGEPEDPSTQTQPLRWRRGVDWLPYQRKTFNTPAFPGYVSGHSAFSRAAAEVLSAFTGSAFFPGGLGEFTAPAGRYLVFERGPSAAVRLQWATYFDAADQAGQSRVWGGIHVPEDDLVGRVVGAQAGQGAWRLARRYFDGSVVAAPDDVVLVWQPGGGEVGLEWSTVRGLGSTVQACPDLGLGWVDVAVLPPATGMKARWTGPRGDGPKGFYRIRQGPTP